MMFRFKMFMFKGGLQPPGGEMIKMFFWEVRFVVGVLNL